MLVSVEGIYQEGQIRLNDDVSVKNDTKVIVTFLEENSVTPLVQNQRLTLDNFSFKKTRDLLKNYKGSFSDAVIEERREAL